MSRVEILQAIRSCARKLKHNPTRRELRLTARVSDEALREVVKGQLQRMKLEFEFESRNFSAPRAQDRRLRRDCVLEA
jgi:hypothetical protein